jgi:hypothetical protein
MDGDIPDLMMMMMMMMPACFGKSPILLVAVFFRMRTSCHSRCETSLLKVSYCLLLVTQSSGTRVSDGVPYS